MTEAQILAEQIRLLQHGPNWVDANIADILNSISAEQAAAKPLNNVHSIWEIANHCIDWRMNTCSKLRGEKTEGKGENYFYEVEDTSNSAWNATREKFADSCKQLAALVEQLTEEQFAVTYGPHAITTRNYIHGIIQHDAYHLGQIVLLSKLLKA
jgi:uncharacterized damage-inducible protein DinB